MTELILHHYDTSPFSEKIRVIFGLKGLAWHSVIQPVIMPKPDLTPLAARWGIPQIVMTSLSGVRAPNTLAAIPMQTTRPACGLATIIMPAKTGRATVST